MHSEKIIIKPRQRVITKDDSITLYNEEYGEHYHATAGAAKEAMVKFAGPCRLKELAQEEGRKEIVLLDVCFGLGYNTAAAIDLIRQHNATCKIIVIGLENDEQVLEELQELEPPFEHYAIIKEVAIAKQYQRNNIEITLLMDDARETIKTINPATLQFDAVFLDPFSPKKCPELWTKEFLSGIKERMKAGAIMATYSCATEVRQNMRDIGFTVKNGVVFGRKAPSTLAIKPFS